MYRGVTKEVELQDDGTKTVKLKYNNALMENMINISKDKKDDKSLRYYEMMYEMLENNNIVKYKEAYPKDNYIN